MATTPAARGGAACRPDQPLNGHPSALGRPNDWLSEWLVQITRLLGRIEPTAATVITLTRQGDIGTRGLAGRLTAGRAWQAGPRTARYSPPACRTSIAAFQALSNTFTTCAGGTAIEGSGLSGAAVGVSEAAVSRGAAGAQQALRYSGHSGRQCSAAGGAACLRRHLGVAGRLRVGRLLELQRSVAGGERARRASRREQQRRRRPGCCASNEIAAERRGPVHHPLAHSDTLSLVQAQQQQRRTAGDWSRVFRSEKKTSLIPSRFSWATCVGLEGRSQEHARWLGLAAGRGQPTSAQVAAAREEAGRPPAGRPRRDRAAS